MKIALLTCHNYPHLEPEDQLYIPLLEEGKIRTEIVDWRLLKDRDLDFDAALIRTTWDYTEHKNEFLQQMQRLHERGIRLFNPFPVVQWNADKRYLLELSQKGLRTIPTLHVQSAAAPTLNFKSDLLVVKPAVGASSRGVERIPFQDLEKHLKNLNPFPDTGVLIQPYFPAIEDEGELSFLFFAGEYAYTVQKQSVPDSFKVHRRFGGKYSRMKSSAKDLAQAEAFVQFAAEKFSTPPTYARVDMVRAPNGDLHLMELELIEPHLYLEYAPEHAATLSQAIIKAL